MSMIFKFRSKKFKSEVQKIFSRQLCLSEYKEFPDTGRITFKLESFHEGVVKYEELKKLSVLLGTDEIGFEGDFEYGYYEEIDKCVNIFCTNVKFECK